MIHSAVVMSLETFPFDAAKKYIGLEDDAVVRAVRECLLEYLHSDALLSSLGVALTEYCATEREIHFEIVGVLREPNEATAAWESIGADSK